MSSARNVHDLVTLIASQHGIIAMETTEEEAALAMARTAASRLKLPLMEWSATSGLVSTPSRVTSPNTDDPAILLKVIDEIKYEAIFFLKDFAPHLNNSVQVRKVREIGKKFCHSRSTVIISGPEMKLPPELQPETVFFTIEMPSRAELDGLVREIYTHLSKAKEIELSMTQDDYNSLLNSLGGLTIPQVRTVLSMVLVEDGKLDASDLKKVQKMKAELLKTSGAIEYYPLGQNALDLGGFTRLKNWLNVAKVGFTDEAKKVNLAPPKGILITGVQGCGKSLAAKFIAQCWSFPLLRLDAGRLYDKFIGESEKNFVKATQVAESMAPCVLWIDEIEKVISTESSGADAGLSQRLFGTFLNWLQEKKRPVFVVATANDLFKLPPELMRKGRFDEIFFVDLPGREERKGIFNIHLKQRNADPRAFDLDELAESSDGFSGAEIEQTVVSALYNALYRQAPFSMDLLKQSLARVIPLSRSRREDIEKLRTLAADRFTPV